MGVSTPQGRHWSVSTTFDVMKRDNLQPQKRTLQEIADLLNELDIPTPTGQGRWHQSGVARALHYDTKEMAT